MIRPKTNDGETILPANFTPSKTDVICGRDQDSYYHEGNQRLRYIVQNSLKIYEMAKTKKEKSMVVMEIVDRIRRDRNDGGFVRKDYDLGRWIEIGVAKAREKVGHSIRIEMKKMKSASVRSKQARLDSFSPPGLPVASTSSPDATYSRRATSPLNQPSRDFQLDTNIEDGKPEPDDACSYDRTTPARHGKIRSNVANFLIQDKNSSSSHSEMPIYQQNTSLFASKPRGSSIPSQASARPNNSEFVFLGQHLEPRQLPLAGGETVFDNLLKHQSKGDLSNPKLSIDSTENVHQQSRSRMKLGQELSNFVGESDFENTDGEL